MGRFDEPLSRFIIDKAPSFVKFELMYTIEGTIKEIFPTQTFDSGFSKREFVVTTSEDKYPQDIVLECLKDNTSLIDPLEKGQTVTVSFDIRGREWKGRYFVNLVAWKIAQEDTKSQNDESPEIEDREDYSEQDDNIPF